MQLRAFVLRLVATATMLSAALPVLSGQLLAVSTGYHAVRPCIADLLARALHIHTVVIALPASMQARQPHKLSGPCCACAITAPGSCQPSPLLSIKRMDVRHVPQPP